ncbi:DUF3885 domain-containing protein [Metabacillus malikii]|uniref:DUF3885 domain-containing protein n=1 Tax=Metabacillus malikii TaxID=1504265 RepID=A0ABT9ZAQ2_9BACI|nr:DUF3885 domain-containing protein [Metabacillus malikii]MDQ0229024.1 hypothetical protein [Metabacillus malikii]
MNVTDFMREAFPNVKLEPGLFYSWDIGMRFELGGKWTNEDDEKYPDSPYLNRCYQRTITLFEALHNPEDDLFIVIDVYDYKNGKNIKRQLVNFPRYVEKSFVNKIKHQKIRYPYSEGAEEDTYDIHRFSLKCKRNDFKYKALLKAICNHDMGVRPAIYHPVYFINIHKRTIFHVYDDRGCDLLATAPEAIRKIYETYNNWILDYDRAEIDQVFA